jgi:hypothetical protein
MNRPSSVAEDSALPLSTRRLASAGYRDALELGLEPLHDIGFHRANACRTADGQGVPRISWAQMLSGGAHGLCDEMKGERCLPKQRL